MSGALRVALVTVTPVGGETGGAERLYAGLHRALIAAGVDCDLIQAESDERDFASIERSYLRFYDMDLRSYDAVISTKAPSYAVRHPVHVCFLLHTMRVFYDMFRETFPSPDATLVRQRCLVNCLDTELLRPPHTRKVFCIGHEVRDRLVAYNGIDAEVVHIPPPFGPAREGAFEYLFLPSRLHRWKRIDMLIDAVRLVRGASLLIAGVGEEEEALRLASEDDPRIVFLGRVSDDQLVDLYADALAVPFTPVREDYGLVVLEAFRSHKPVITCSDSGEPAVIVEDGRSGFVCPPKPDALADRIEQLYDDRSKARWMGDHGNDRVRQLAWSAALDPLLEALRP